MPTQAQDRNTVIRPGFIVSLKTSLVGNITYHKVMLEREHIVDDGTEHARWETKRVIGDRTEHNNGRKAQMDARAKVTAICTNTAFGLLCPQDHEAELRTALREAEGVIDAFNRSASYSRASLHYVVGEILSERFDAVGAMATEALELITTIKTGITERKADNIRDAANELRRLSEMFSDAGREPLQSAINAGRGAARKIVKFPDGPVHELETQALTVVEGVWEAFNRLVRGGSLSLNTPV